MADIAALKRSRGSVKTKLTRFRTYLNAFEPDTGNPVELNERLRKAENLMSEFDGIQERIRILDIDEMYTNELEEEYEVFEHLYYEAIAKGREKIAGLNTQNDNENQQNTVQRPKIAEVDRPNVKIPTIALPDFDGSYENWTHFYDLFKALIDADATLSNVQKFYYLNSALKGQAAKVISSLEITGENYTVALDILKERFQNKRLTTRHHVRALFDLPQVPKESAIGLRALSDELSKHLRALKNLGEPVDEWNTLVVELVLNKIDPISKREWEEKAIAEDRPTVDQLKTFLSNRCQVLEAVQQKKTVQENNSKYQGGSNSKHRVDHSTSHFSTQNATAKNYCVMCKEDHKIYQCQKLRDLPVQSRINEIKRLSLCLNCLGKGHTVKNCKAGNCKHCSKKHNSLLHLEDRSDSAQQKSSDSKINTSNDNESSHKSKEQQAVQSIATCAMKRPAQILLSSAIVYIEDNAGNKIEARALLDSGSQSNFMSRALCEKLNLQKRKINQSIGAIAQTVTQISAATSATIRSKVNAFSVKLSFSILDEITEKIPLVELDPQLVKIPNHVVLADPGYHVPQSIDLLLGAGVFWDLICAEQIRTGKNQPVLQKTKLGWIISGPYTTENQQANTREFCGFSDTRNLQDQLQRFWKIEELQTTQTWSQEELSCEKHFVQTHTRLPSGRFEVRLPCRNNPSQLGESYGNALKRLRSIERKFIKYPLVKTRYTAFMDEYEALGHMSIVEEDNELETKNYLPHHAVMNEERATTKLRVVFDASSRTTSGKSLNDILMVGPVIQRELVEIVARFRQHEYVLIADITKMYRQISVNPEDRDLQRILWRNEVTTTPNKYRLNTLTYGTGPASFLATRCLAQLSIENAETFPEASEIIKKDFYMDDLITGGSSVTELHRRRAEIKEILESASFPLQKWKSNAQAVLEDSDKTDSSLGSSIGEETKILGLRWRASEDLLYYKVSVTEEEQRPTKRGILSFVSQLFDPLGLIGPATIKAKILLQQLWQLQLGWDEALPMDIHTKWIKYKENLLEINNIEIPRHALCKNPIRIELHGFCDASTLAYGACLYLKSTDSSGFTSVHLLCAKSRVAPIKPVSLPRLELCGALLLSQLYKKLVAALTIEIHRTIFWCDSSVTLSWIRGQPHQWKEFVRNRVTEIQDTTKKDDWRHVRSEHNPADIISRGIDPNQLTNARLWWHGPDWLQEEEDIWPTSACPPVEEIPESKTISLAFPTIESNEELFERFSSLRKLQRVVAYVLRYKNNSKTSHEQRTRGTLTIEELQNAMNVLVKLAQRQSFPEELNDLKKNRIIHSKSRLLDLHPFIDDNDVIRVGGRLRNAPLSLSKRYPIVLSGRHPLTRLIIMHFHHRDLHAGPSALLAALREQYWIISARNTIRSVLRKCITCFRLRPVSPTQLMGSLPPERVTPSRAFSCVGVDYAGPYTIRVSRNKTAKAYLCLFVCLATKAVHLEIVSDMTTSAFLNSLKRFISRRGRCKSIHSDNGTNFIGANNVMKQFAELLTSKAHQETVIKFASDQSIEWRFIPPHSPHVGGLWESAVKLAKTHAKAVIGDTSLSFEELSTVFCQIEACLNSRPLCPLSSDPSELEVLTPGHFLVGSALTALPEEDVSDIQSNRLNRYQLLTKMHQNFWRRWSQEYVTQLQQRTKWKSEKLNEHIKAGSMVLLRDITPPLQWRLGRIVEVHPGKDGLIRTVTVKTQNGTTQRTLPKICVLPID